MTIEGGFRSPHISSQTAQERQRVCQMTGSEFNMIKYQEHYEAFLKVRDELKKRREYGALALAFHRPFKFYGEHSVEETVELLIKEANQYD